MNGSEAAERYADEINSFAIGDVVAARFRPSQPVWIIEGFRNHDYRPGGRSVLLRSLKTGRPAIRDVVDVTYVRTTS